MSQPNVPINIPANNNNERQHLQDATSNVALQDFQVRRHRRSISQLMASMGNNCLVFLAQSQPHQLSPAPC